MHPQDAEMLIEDTLTWYGDKVVRDRVQCTTPSGKLVWIVPVYGVAPRVAVSVQTVLTQMVKAVAILEPQPNEDAYEFIAKCENLIELYGKK